jgi:hypothetical protein
MNFARLFTYSALLAAMCTTSLSAQGSEHSLEVKHRNDCRLAARVLRTGQSNTRRDWAISVAPSCGDVGPVALAEQWRSISANDPVFEHLVRSSPRVRDNRLYRELMSTAGDRSRPAGVRAAAMLVLSRYVDPYSAAWLTDLVPPDSIGHIRLIGGSAAENVQVSGNEPIPGPVAASVLSLLQRLAADRAGEPREVWYAAAVLARRVQRDIELGRAQ